MRRALPWLAAALLLGCAGTPRAPVIAGLEVDLTRVTDWVASGRIGIVVPGSGGSGTFVWRQRDDWTDLSVRGPLGAGGLQIETDGVALRVTDANGERLDAEAARGLIRSRLGADLPLAQLRYWMLGLPAPGADAEVRVQAEAPVRRIEQSGWSVAYEQFVTAKGWSVPARLTASSGPLRVKAIVDHWQLQPDAGPADRSLRP